ncbi:Stonin-2 [Bagarius yarrelli]|uniref:Stonin-2 n=1 Tax=Bagarius yarrelli TaxID=175774 RepID=A0A556VB34_BAGYA|nr:Stonin-2 [Bagarius yarrelli]
MSRFDSWVTFDDDVEQQAYPQVSEPFDVWTGETKGFHVQDTNSNLIVSSVVNQTRDGRFFDVTPDETASFDGGGAEGVQQFKKPQISDWEASSPPDSGDSEEVPYVPPHMVPRDGWPVLLRVPEKKNVMSSRHWGPVFARLEAGRLKLYYEKGLEKPFKEFRLVAGLEITDHETRLYKKNGHVHSLSLVRVVYKEKRRIQTPVKEQLVKLGTVDYHDFVSLRYALQEQLVSVDVKVGVSPVSYSEEEIQIEVADTFHALVSEGNRILHQLVTTRISALAFLTGSPLCSMGLNDVRLEGKEAVSRQDIIPNTTERWICLHDCRLHECVDRHEFEKTGNVSFCPPSGRRFELLSFRTRYAEKSLPFTLRTVVCVRGAEVELQSWLAMSNRDPLSPIPCENVAVCFPVPDMWVKNFCRDNATGEKSLKTRVNRGANFNSVSFSGSELVMRVTLGTAKYEEAFRSVCGESTVCQTRTQFYETPLLTNHNPAQLLLYNLIGVWAFICPVFIVNPWSLEKTDKGTTFLLPIRWNRLRRQLDKTHTDTCKNSPSSLLTATSPHSNTPPHPQPNTPPISYHNNPNALTHTALPMPQLPYPHCLTHTPMPSPTLPYPYPNGLTHTILLVHQWPHPHCLHPYTNGHTHTTFTHTPTASPCLHPHPNDLTHTAFTHTPTTSATPPHPYPQGLTHTPLPSPTLPYLYPNVLTPEKGHNYKQ